MKFSGNSPAGALKKFARGLLTTTCLTAAATGVAQAGLIVNETSVAGADFGNTFAGNGLGPGVTEVIGQLNPASDVDYFFISGLLAGGSYTITGLYTGFANYEILNSVQGVLNASSSNNPSMSGTIPGDGILVVHVTGAEQVGTYDLTVSAPTAVPEPSTLSGVGLALAAGLALRRKLAK